MQRARAARVVAMLVLGYIQQSKHLRILSRCWIAAIPWRRSKVTTGEPLKYPFSRHVSFHNSAAPIRLAVLLSPDFSAHHLRREKQVVSARPFNTAGHTISKSDNLKLAQQGRRAVFAKRKNKSGGRDSELFEEWLKANPLPDSLVKEGSQVGNGGLDDESTSAAEEFGAYHKSSFEEFRVGKLTGEESGDSEMLAGRMLVRGQEVLQKLVSPSFVNGCSDGSAKLSGLKWGENGPQQSREFSWEETGDLLYECLCDCDELVWSCETRRFLEVNSSRGGRQIEFIPPLILPPLSSCCTSREYLQSLHQRRGRQGNKQLIALLSSNAAALAIFNDGKLLLHKVLTAYTVRAQQGKSQMKYLRQGGPGRMTVGGAIRARETDRFFSRVCEVQALSTTSSQSFLHLCHVLARNPEFPVLELECTGKNSLDRYAEDGNVEQCIMKRMMRLVSLGKSKRGLTSGAMRFKIVYAADNSKTLVPRNDSRWCKVPYNVHEPRFLEIQRVFYRLSHGAVRYTCNHEQQPLH